MTVATVVTEGFGSFGARAFIPTEGFGNYGAPPTPPAVEPTSGPLGRKHWRYLDTEEERYRRYLARLARELPTVAVPDRTRRFAAIVRRLDTPAAAAAFEAAKAAAEAQRDGIAAQARIAAREAIARDRAAQRATAVGIALAAAADLAEDDDVANILLLH